MFETGDYKVSARTESTGWALCDGTAYEQSAQPGLYAVIGDTYNVEGTATGWFCVPDLRGRVFYGATAQHPLGTPLGAADVTLSAANMPPHSHAVNVLDAQGGQLNPGGNYLAGGTVDRTSGQPAYGTFYTNAGTYDQYPQYQSTLHAGTIGNAGGNAVNGQQVAQPVSVLQPAIAANVFIKL